MTVSEAAESIKRPGLELPVCQESGPVYECVQDVTGVPVGGETRFKFAARVEAGAKGPLAGQIEVSGGGAADNVSEPFMLRAEPAVPFAVKDFGIGLLDSAGAPVTQGGATPAEQSTGVSFVSEARDNFGIPGSSFLVSATPESYRDVVVHVPVGFVGNPTATPVRCAPSQLTTPIANTTIPQCPLGSQVGVIELYAGGDLVPLYNVEPPAGSPAEFAFFYQSVVVRLLAKLRPADDGIDIVTTDVVSSVPLPQFKVTLWGAPGDSSHDPLRGHCLQNGYGNDGENCPLGESERSTTPFLRMPTSCTGEPLQWDMEVDTYQHPGVWHEKSTTTPAVENCQSVPFAPSFSATPSSLAPGAASGLDATLSLPQDNPSTGVAQADLRNATVALPAGLALNPSSANGLQACTDAQLRLGLEGAAQCPDASKLGTLTLTTPLIDHPLGGSIFVRTQNSSDPTSGEMFRIALEIRSDEDGIDIKLPGSVKIDPTTGQITTTFADQPQLPFSKLELHFTGGADATFVTPGKCGSYATQATFTGWNGKAAPSGNAFTIASGGSGCQAGPFAPILTAGAGNPVAGAFTPFALQLTRTDADQQIAAISDVKLPLGLTGEIASIPVRCTDAQAAAAACPAASRVGNVTVGAGVGSDPFYITDGNAYLTGPYKGAPFGLAFVVHALAGPFDLGNVVVRAAIQIDPHTAQVTIASDPLPTMIDGVPLHIRDIRVSVDRPGFMLNPTNCSPLAVGANVTSTEGASAALSNRFQVGECEKLAFHPKFAVSTAGKTSRKNGASLKVKISYPKGAEANLRSVRVTLPHQLPSRIETLQKACLEKVFNADPAACPLASRVGTATVATPLLASKLTGPAYFVSHGIAKFPELVFVLQGEGVTVILNGETFISEKTSVTSNTFRSLPDVPFSSFELSLPQGRYSALAAPRGLCHGKLVMPTALTAQNGRTIHQNTPISVSGCPKAHRPARPKRTRK